MFGLELAVDGGLIRFRHGTAPLLFMDERVGKLNGMVSELVEARDAAVRRAEEEAKRAEELALEVERLRVELERRGG